MLSCWYREEKSKRIRLSDNSNSFPRTSLSIWRSTWQTARALLQKKDIFQKWWYTRNSRDGLESTRCWKSDWSQSRHGRNRKPRESGNNSYKNSRFSTGSPTSLHFSSKTSNVSLCSLRLSLGSPTTQPPPRTGISKKSRQPNSYINSSPISSKSISPFKSETLIAMKDSSKLYCRSWLSFRRKLWGDTSQPWHRQRKMSKNLKEIKRSHRKIRQQHQLQKKKTRKRRRRVLATVSTATQQPNGHLRNISSRGRQLPKKSWGLWQFWWISWTPQFQQKTKDYRRSWWRVASSHCLK